MHDEANSTPTRVLVVEDYRQVRQWLVRVLRRMDADPIEAADGEAAIAALARLDVDLVMLDWTLPGLSGSDVLDVLEVRWPDIPVVIATGHALGALDLARHNVLACIRKPFDYNTLKEVLAAALGARSPSSPPRGSGAPAAAGGQGGAGVAPKVLGRVGVPEDLL